MSPGKRKYSATEPKYHWFLSLYLRHSMKYALIQYMLRHKAYLSLGRLSDMMSLHGINVSECYIWSDVVISDSSDEKEIWLKSGTEDIGLLQFVLE